MTTWLPSICAAIVVLFTMWLATDRAFSHGRDRPLGAAIGFIAGLGIAAMFYALVRMGAWMIGGMS
ncbi:hypothetical protein M8009_00515 [Halomonas sp. ATCH28]|uniref:Uncharacterized protein n=1 Tax=Halomonas gemina TaxID=2945105 RepID=A0ABT0SVU7_9GAMM|nr:hypothetical protein [Halomonas gemina]MCL7938785.1 hypothetical protein [Halomonas gemina]